MSAADALGPYHWVWIEPQYQEPKAHVFGAETTRSLCGYADISKARLDVDIGLMVTPRKCGTCVLIVSARKLVVETPTRLDHEP